MNNQKLQEVLRDNYIHNCEIAESEIINIQEEISEYADKGCNSITPDQLKFANYTVSVVYCSLLKTFESSTKNLLELLADTFQKD